MFEQEQLREFPDDSELGIAQADETLGSLRGRVLTVITERDWKMLVKSAGDSGSLRELAEEFGLPKSTVDDRLRRSKQRLAEAGIGLRVWSENLPSDSKSRPQKPPGHGDRKPVFRISTDGTCVEFPNRNAAARATDCAYGSNISAAAKNDRWYAGYAWRNERPSESEIEVISLAPQKLLSQDSEMLAAFNSGMSVRAMAKKFDVPKSTVLDRLQRAKERLLAA